MASAPRAAVALTVRSRGRWYEPALGPLPAHAEAQQRLPDRLPREDGRAQPLPVRLPRQEVEGPGAPARGRRRAAAGAGSPGAAPARPRAAPALRSSAATSRPSRAAKPAALKARTPLRTYGVAQRRSRAIVRGRCLSALASTTCARRTVNASEARSAASSRARSSALGSRTNTGGCIPARCDLRRLAQHLLWACTRARKSKISPVLADGCARPCIDALEADEVRWVNLLHNTARGGLAVPRRHGGPPHSPAAGTTTPSLPGRPTSAASRPGTAGRTSPPSKAGHARGHRPGHGRRPRGRAGRVHARRQPPPGLVCQSDRSVR